MALNSSISDCSNGSTRYINDEREAAELLYSSVEVAFASIVVPCMMAISFLTNSAFIYTVYRRPELHTITNAYLVNMAVADIIYVEVDGIVHFVLPCMMSPLKSAVHFGQSECIVHVFVNISYYTSFVLITCVAVERYLAICYPFYQQMVSGKSRTIKIIIASWLLGGIFTSITAVPQGWNLKTLCIDWPNGEAYSMLPKKFSSCSTLPGFPLVLSQVTDTLLYILALLISLIVYTKIIITLKRRASQDLGTKIQHKAQREHNQVAQLLVINGIVFFLCFTPWQFKNFVSIVNNLTDSHLVLNFDDWYLPLIGMFMSYVNSSVNPLVYMICSSTYRNAYMKTFGLNCNKRGTIKTLGHSEILNSSARNLHR